MWADLQRLMARVRAFFSASTLDSELDVELKSHAAMLIDENIRRGMAPEEARRDALMRLGAREAIKEEHRALRGLPFLDTLKQDLRYTFRTLRRDAAFAAFAILIVGIGIGASCTIFSVVNTLLLRPLPFHDAAQIAWLANRPGSGAHDLSGQTVQVGYLLDLQKQTRSFSELAGYFAFYGIGDANLIGSGEPERFTNVPVTRNFFSMLGVQPIVGRQFTADEARDGGPKAVMLSYGLWRTRFNRDAGVIGRGVNINGTLATVVGVLPESFDFGDIFAPGTHADLFTPFPLNDRTNRQGNTLAIVGRLDPGVTVAAAQADTEVIASAMHHDHPERNGFTPEIAYLSQYVSGRIRPALLLLACGGRGDADRLRESFQPVAGARRRAAEGNCNPVSARRDETSAGAANVDRKPCAFERGRSIGAAACVCRDARAFPFERHGDSSPGKRAHRRSIADIYDGGSGLYGRVFRVDAGTACAGADAARIVERCPSRLDRRRRTRVDSKCAGGFRDCAGVHAGGWGGAADP